MGLYLTVMGSVLTSLLLLAVSAGLWHAPNGGPAAVVLFSLIAVGCLAEGTRLRLDEREG